MDSHFIQRFIPPVFLLSLFFAAGCSDPGEYHPIRVSEAVLRELLPGKHNTVAYMTLENHSGRTCNLTGGSAEFAERIEVHEHLHGPGGMRMQLKPALAITPGDQVELRPGGYHLMVMGVTSPLIQGEQYRISLEFADCPPLHLTIPVTGLL